ncbi:hypothetical protein [Nocardia veterana]|uniref:Uncharacterized protein n=1 Tax=Nocardia veterana TaxID=132249 RepID=A0A7X6RJ78_9NOCA|nr:hypothetical protein [Nocardia veterana]NKY87383.1 hypothetical protein [Nocardia veterana]
MNPVRAAYPFARREGAATPPRSRQLDDPMAAMGVHGRQDQGGGAGPRGGLLLRG